MILNSAAGVSGSGPAIGYLRFIVSLNKSLNLSKLSNIVISEGIRLDKLKGNFFSFNALQ